MSFYFSCVYGHPNRKLRHILWERLQRIALNRFDPWLLCGDFNEILHPNEKRGGRVRENWSLLDFRNTVKICKVKDLPFKGNNMTWMGKRRSHTVECWLDRAMANDYWRATYPASEVEYLEMIESDHRPAIIRIRRTTEQGFKPFQFDTRLTGIPEFEEVICQSWNKHMQNNEGTVYERIKICRREISAWKRSNATNSANQIKELTQAIDEAHSDHTFTMEKIRALRKELLQAYKDEEIL